MSLFLRSYPKLHPELSRERTQPKIAEFRKAIRKLKGHLLLLRRLNRPLRSVAVKTLLRVFVGVVPIECGSLFRGSGIFEFLIRESSVVARR